MSFPTMTARSEIEALCAKLVAARAPQVPLVRAAADSRIGLLMIHSPAVAWPAATVVAYGARPLCVLIGADAGYGSDDVAPDTWACARRLKYWRPNAVIVHGAAGEPEHHRGAVALTLAVGRVALIETTSRHADAWRQFLGCSRTIGIFPRGGEHPVAPVVRH